jgi:formyl-CoA transferase
MLPPDNAEPFDALVEIIGRPELRTDARFAAPPARAKNAEALTSIIEVWARERDKRQVMAAFARRGIPCGAVLDTAEVLDDAHLQERGTVRDLEHPTRGRFKMIGSPLRLSDSSLELAAAPLYGQHTDEVLQKLAGYSVEEVKRLREAKVVS